MEPSISQFQYPVMYVPAQAGKTHQVIDYAESNAAGQWVGRYSGQTLEVMATRYPGVVLGELDTVIAEREAALVTQPVEVTEEQFTYGLSVLPPVDFISRGGNVTFKMLERLDGRITGVYACIEGRYYSFHDVCTISHDEIVAKVMAAR